MGSDEPKFFGQNMAQELNLEEVKVEMVSFWVQIRGVPLFLTSEANVRHLTNEIGEFIEFEYPSKARGFFRARAMVNTSEPLTTSCWLPRENNMDTWVEFRY